MNFRIRIIILVLFIVFLLMVNGCSSPNETVNDVTPTPIVIATPTPEPTQEPTPTPEPTPTLEQRRELAINELNDFFENVGIDRINFFKSGRPSDIALSIYYSEPYNRDDFPTLVESSIDACILITDNYNCPIHLIEILLEQHGSVSVFYRASTSDRGNNDELKEGEIIDRAFIIDRSYKVAYNEIPVSEENAEINKLKLEELEIITILGIGVSKPNLFDGIDVTIEWVNNSENTIKYIYFTFIPYNAVDDIVTCTISGKSTIKAQATGPFETGITQKSKVEAAWYNANIVRTELIEINIEYMDGAQKRIIIL